MRTFYLLCAFLFCSLITTAQSNQGSISGKIVDQSNQNAIAFATVSVYNAADTTLLGYKVSDEKGSFKLNNLPTNSNLRVVITYTGFGIYRNTLVIPTADPNVQLGNIPLEATFQNIEEIIIKAERPPILIKKDTIEFNAAAFKTLPDALVEDLLRKLPGVTVDKNGNILVNGKAVNTIYVDGKDFFGGDVKIASRNLPANTIDKVEVTQDQLVLRANPLMHEADIPLVINLKLKPGIKKGAFGKIYAGGGINDKHELGALINLFRDTTQISILAYSNNLNKAAFNFTDIRSVGGFNRSSWGSASGNGNGGLSIDKVSFGGFGSGLMESTGGGGNFNTIIGKKIQFGMNYFFGAVDSDYDEIRNTAQTLNSDIVGTSQKLKQFGTNNAHLISSKLVFKIAPKVTVDLKPQLVLSRTQMDRNLNIQSVSQNSGSLNESINVQKNNTDNNLYNVWTVVNADFNKKGRNLNLTNYIVLDHSENPFFNDARNTFFNPPSNNVLKQLRQSETKNENSMSMLRYKDTFGDQFTLSLGLTYNMGRNLNDINTYFEDQNGQYQIPVDQFTENYDRKFFKTDADAGLRWKKGKLSVNTSIMASDFKTRNTFTKSPKINQNYFFLQPSVEFNFSTLRLSYQSRYRETALANLQPLTDNSNPLFLRKGDPNLRPSFHHMFNLGIQKFDIQKSLNYQASISNSYIKDATIIARTVDASGVQTTYPINGSGVWSLGSNFSFQKNWKLENNKQFSILAGNSFTLNNSFVLVNDEKSDLRSINFSPRAELRINLKDKFEINQSYNYTGAYNHYENNLFENRKLVLHDLKSEIILRPTQKIVFETTLDYRYNSNIAPGLLKEYYKLNAAITYIFLKGQRGQLKLSVNDIFDQNIISERILRENFIEDMQGSTIRRHGLLTFTYNLRNFGGKVGGRNSLF